MGTESIEASFLSIFALISFFIFLFVSKYSHRLKGGALLDKDFSKPQAFHDLSVSRGGGLASIISLNIFGAKYSIAFQFIFLLLLSMDIAIDLMLFNAPSLAAATVPEYNKS